MGWVADFALSSGGDSNEMTVANPARTAEVLTSLSYARQIHHPSFMNSRTLLCIASLLAGGCSTSLAAVSLIFSSASTGRATNWLDGNGVSTTKMVWGIVVDTGGNGFKPGEYLSGFSYPSGGPPPYVLQTASGPTDDLLILSANLMVSLGAPSDGAPSGMNQLTFLSAFSYADGTPEQIVEGDKFRIIWFDQTVLTGSAETGTLYGMFELPLLNTMPANDGGTYSKSSEFAGADAPKAMAYQLVPEPTAVLLSMAGLLSFVLRRDRFHGRCSGMSGLA
jgi:hypothetical protein